MSKTGKGHHTKKKFLPLSSKAEYHPTLGKLPVHLATDATLIKEDLEHDNVYTALHSPHLSQGEKSISWTLSCSNLPTLSNSGPPHSATPGLWRVARYEPCGDQRRYVSVQRWGVCEEGWECVCVCVTVLAMALVASVSNIIGSLH